MKTIIARFQELKKSPGEIVEVDGEEVSLNKIDTALKSIGITLTDTTGQFRNLDEVFLEISQKWNGLDKNTQRYIATVAAGSRQQSRFIAMMSDYERTMELVDAANNSAGASQKQYEKTLESLESKLNKLKNAWNEFTMGIANNEMVKFGVDALRKLLETINEITKMAGPLEPVAKILTSIFAIKIGGKVLTGGIKVLSSLLGLKGQKIDTAEIQQGVQEGAYRGIIEAFEKAGIEIKDEVKESIEAGAKSANFEFKNLDRDLQSKFTKVFNKVQKNGKNGYNFNSLLTKFKIDKTLSKDLKREFFSSKDILEPIIVSLKQELNKIAELGDEAGDRLIQEFSASIISGKADIAQAMRTLNKEIKGQTGQTIDPNFSVDFSGNKALRGMSKGGSALNELSDLAYVAGLEGLSDKLMTAGMAVNSFTSLVSMVPNKIKGIPAAFKGLKAGATGATASLKAAGGSLLKLAGPIGLIGGALITGIAIWNNHKKKVEEAQKAFDEAGDTFRNETKEIDNNINSIGSISSEFKELSNGINDEGRNINLTSEEYNRYNELKQQLIDMNPSIIKGYNSEGQAIIDNNTALKEAIDLQEEARKTATRDYLTKWEEDEENGWLGYKTRRNEIFEDQVWYDNKMDNNDYAYIDINGSRQSIHSGNNLLEHYDEIYAQEVQRIKNYKDFTEEERKEQLAAWDEYLSSEKSQLEAKKALNEEAARYLKVWVTTEQALGGLGINTSNLTEFTKQYEEGLVSIADNTKDLEDAQEKTKKFTETFNSLVTSYGSNGIADEIKNINQAQKEFKEGLEDGELSSEDYRKEVSKQVDSIRELADTYRDSAPEIAKALDQIASGYEEFSEKFSLDDAFDISSLGLDGIRKQYEEWKKVSDKDYDVALENFANIYKDLFSEDANDSLGRGSLAFWDAAERFFGSANLEKWGRDIDVINQKFKELKDGGALEGEYASTDWLYNSFGKIMDSSEKLKNELKELGVTRNKYGGYNLKVNNSDFDELAEKLGISKELMISLLDNARQFGNITFSSPEEIALGIKNAEESMEGFGNKTFYAKHLLVQQAEQAGITGAQLQQMLDDIEARDDIELFDLNNALETLEVINEIQRKNELLPNGEEGNKKQIDFDNYITTMLGFGASSDQILQNWKEGIEEGYSFGAILEDGNKGKVFNKSSSYNNLDNENLAKDFIEKKTEEYTIQIENDPIVKKTSEIATKVSAAVDLLEIIALEKTGKISNGRDELNNSTIEQNQEAYDSGNKQQQKTAIENSKAVRIGNEERKAQLLEEQKFFDEGTTEYDAIETEIKKLEEASEKLHKQEWQIKLSPNIKGKTSGKLYDLLVSSGKTTEEIDTIFNIIEKSDEKTQTKLFDLLNQDGVTQEGMEVVLSLVEKGYTLEEVEDGIATLKSQDGEEVKISIDTTNPEMELGQLNEDMRLFLEPKTGIIKVKDKAGKKIEKIGNLANAYEGEYVAYLKELGYDNINDKISLLLADLTTLTTTTWSVVWNWIKGDGGDNPPSEDSPKKGPGAAKGTPGRVRPGQKNYRTAYKGKRNGAKGGPTLTGELGPELVWSGDSAYLVGEYGPEVVDLKPHDTVYTHIETRKILKGQTFKHNNIPALGGGATSSGSYTPGGGNPSKGTGSGGSSSGSSGTVKNNTKSTDNNTKSTDKNTKKLNKIDERLDKLYNTMRFIDRELRMVNKYQERYERLLQNIDLTGQDLITNLKKQAHQYNLIIKRSEYAKDTRQAQAKNLLNSKAKWEYEVRVKDKNGDYKEETRTKYSEKKLDHWLNYDAYSNMFTVDKSRLEKLRKSKVGSDRALYNHIVKDIIPRLEGYQSDIEEMNDNIEDAKNALEDMKDLGKESLRNIEDRVLEAIISREQKKIDKLSQINDSVNNANQDMVNAIQTNLSKIREERDNKETEKDIAAKERRLAYLRRDTSNANALEIKQLEEELSTQKQDYTDTLIDQKISELQEQNDMAAEQRQQQIDLLQAQLDWDSKNGVFWDEAYRLIEQGIDETGRLVETSDLVALLKSEEGFAGLSVIGQMDWYQTLQTEMAQANVYLENIQNSLSELSKTLLYAVQTGEVGVGETVTWSKDEGSMGKGGSFSGTVMDDGKTLYYEGAKGDNVHFEIPLELLYKDGDGKWKFKDDNKYSLDDFRKFDIYNQSSGNTKKKQKIVAKKKGTKDKLVEVMATRNDDGTLTGPSGTNYPKVIKGSDGKYYTPAAWPIATKKNPKLTGTYAQFKQGGLANFTGPAWLDGTKSKPELVLNQRDTENFILLKDVLSSLLNSNMINGSNNSGDNIYEVNINVDKLENDYDVEQVAEKVKRMINSDARYRNVNAINRMR